MNFKNLILKEAKEINKDVPKCIHFNQCGGCILQNLSYKNQLKLKEKALERLGIFAKVIPSPKIWGFRNRLDFTASKGKLGFRVKNTWDKVFDVSNCLIMSKEVNQILEKVRFLSSELKIPFYDVTSHEGNLRYVVIREGKFTKERMINFITKSEKSISDLMSHFDEVSIIHSVNDSLSDISKGRFVSYIGKNYITEELNGIKYIIGPNSFFQTNPYQAKKVFSKIKSIVKGSKKVLDLFCGVGGISLYVADVVNEVEGVEIEVESIINANQSKELNKISNVSFEISDVKDFNLKNIYDFVIVDPPRQGLTPTLAKKLSNFDRILYMSCNPVSQIEDLKCLNHRIVESYAFDMFPHTPHVETLLVLEKK